MDFKSENDLQIAVGGIMRQAQAKIIGADDISGAATLLNTFNAENFLKSEYADYSANNNDGRNFAIGFAIVAIIGIIALFSERASMVFLIIAGIIGAPISLFRLFASFVSAPKISEYKSAKMQIAPIYTLLIAVYREESVISGLIGALEKLEWPVEKLDIIFLCEDEDTATIKKIENHQSELPRRIVCLPKGAPQTKPRALQAGLGFARGRFIGVYDAEDMPHPNQLREAYEVFTKADETLGVVQAPLIAWNSTESWISGQFALEYAAWFRVILPAIARFSNYLPLGGTSNHFRTSALKKVGGWDPFNVTEDADLGARLCRFGFKAALISAPTKEEAPPHLKNWIRQRSRWMHGHLQTMAVHLRNPKHSLHQMGASSFIAFCLSITSGPLNVVLRLPMIIYCIYGILFLDWPQIHLILLTLALFGEIVINMVAMMRDKRSHLMISLLSLPFYWLMQIPAFCRALSNIVRRPHFWEKTDHGSDARSQLNKCN